MSDSAFDAELRQDFLVEAGELIQSLDEQLVQLEAAPLDVEQLNKVFRAFHTVKGGAGFLALEPMVQLCHHAEDLLNAARGLVLQLQPVHMDALLEAVDRLKEMMQSLACGTPLAAAAPALLQRLAPPAATPSRPEPSVVPTPADGSPIDDLEFEALLDRLYGDAAPGHTTTAATGIDDDEFEALLDELHGAAAPLAPRSNEVPRCSPSPPPLQGRGGLGRGWLPTEQPNKLSQKGLSPTDSAERPNARAASPAADSTVRVDTARLDAVVRRAGELVLLRNRISRLAAHAETPGLQPAAALLKRVADELQRDAMGLRMQPVGRLFQRFPRLVRDLARQLGKEVSLALEGEGTDLDRGLVEALADPLIHLLRNALDHGLETPAERERAGKSRQGAVRLAASQRGERIVITVSDDGRGMDAELLRRKALEKGLIDAAEAARLDERECHELIFRPGFSTAAVVSDVSGRGVGMDVVKTRVMELGGTLSVRSRLGQGSALELAVPLTLAVGRMLMVRAGAQMLALPLANVEEVFELCEEQAQAGDETGVTRHRGRTLVLVNLCRWVGAAHSGGRQVVVVQIGHRRLGCRADHILGREAAIVSPLGPLFRGVPGIAGATITGEGELALVLDLGNLADADGAPLPAARRCA